MINPYRRFCTSVLDLPDKDFTYGYPLSKTLSVFKDDKNKFAVVKDNKKIIELKVDKHKAVTPYLTIPEDSFSQSGFSSGITYGWAEFFNPNFHSFKCRLRKKATGVEVRKVTVATRNLHHFDSPTWPHCSTRQITEEGFYRYKVFLNKEDLIVDLRKTEPAPTVIRDEKKYKIFNKSLKELVNASSVYLRMGGFNDVFSHLCKSPYFYESYVTWDCVRSFYPTKDWIIDVEDTKYNPLPKQNQVRDEIYQLARLWAVNREPNVIQKILLLAGYCAAISTSHTRSFGDSIEHNSTVLIKHLINSNKVTQQRFLQEECVVFADKPHQKVLDC